MVGATFCVYSDKLDPAAVTAKLGIKPSESFTRGSPIVTRKRYGDHPTGGWLLRSRDHVPSSDLQEHLIWLLGQLKPASTAIQALVSAGMDVAIICTLSGTPGGGGPTVDATTLNDIAALGVPVDLDIYC